MAVYADNYRWEHSPFENVKNSSIEVWFQYNGPETLNFTPLCQIEANGSVFSTSCETICNDTFELIRPYNPPNLLTCGIWATLVTDANLKGIPIASIQPSAASPNLSKVVEHFGTLGLNSKDPSYARAVYSAISATLNLLFQYSRTRSMLEQPHSKSCRVEYLFESVGTNRNTIGMLQSCLRDICAPSYLDQDLGGIGVRQFASPARFRLQTLQIIISLLMQLGIGLLLMVSLVYTTFQLLKRPRKDVKHALNLATGLVEFHKAQCFFISAIQVAAILLFIPSSVPTERALPAQKNALLLFVPISMNGVVPITSTLMCILLFARLSYHVLLLSAIPLALSTVVWWHTYLQLRFHSEPPPTKRMQSFIGNRQLSSATIFETIRNVCGSESGNLRYGPGPDEFNYSVVWMIYAYSVTWAFICLLKHVPDTVQKQSLYEWIHFKPRNLSRMFHLRTLVTGFGVVSFVLWMLCFAYVFYMYSLFVNGNAISATWYFSQIIAVNVWTPSIAEFIYLELLGVENGSKYKYPPGVHAVINHGVTSRKPTTSNRTATISTVEDLQTDDNTFTKIPEIRVGEISFFQKWVSRLAGPDTNVQQQVEEDKFPFV